MSDRWVTLATFSQGLEAQVLKTKLESENIEAFVADENLIQMNWLFSNALGGVKVQVKEKDLRRAKEILASDSSAEIHSANEMPALICPNCKSDKLVFEKLSKQWFWLSWLLLGFPLIFFKEKWRCKSCGHEWTDSSRLWKSSGDPPK